MVYVGQKFHKIGELCFSKIYVDVNEEVTGFWFLMHSGFLYEI